MLGVEFKMEKEKKKNRGWKIGETEQQRTARRPLSCHCFAILAASYPFMSSFFRDIGPNSSVQIDFHFYFFLLALARSRVQLLSRRARVPACWTPVSATTHPIHPPQRGPMDRDAAPVVRALIAAPPAPARLARGLRHARAAMARPAEAAEAAEAGLSAVLLRALGCTELGAVMSPSLVLRIIMRMMLFRLRV
jgi:hypothetical protein